MRARQAYQPREAAIKSADRTAQNQAWDEVLAEAKKECNEQSVQDLTLPALKVKIKNLQANYRKVKDSNATSGARLRVLSCARPCLAASGSSQRQQGADTTASVTARRGARSGGGHRAVQDDGRGHALAADHDPARAAVEHAAEQRQRGLRQDGGCAPQAQRGGQRKRAGGRRWRGRRCAPQRPALCAAGGGYAVSVTLWRRCFTFNMCLCFVFCSVLCVLTCVFTCVTVGPCLGEAVPVCSLRVRAQTRAAAQAGAKPVFRS